MSLTKKAKHPSHYSADQVAKYFDEFGIREWDRLVSNPVDEVSLYIHTYYLKQYIPKGAHVLEVGAGPGRFTQILAGLNARILVADISKVQLDLNKRHAHELGFAHAVEGWQEIDICDMRRLKAKSFDVVVAYGGPFSYVFDKRDIALQECLRLLSPHGLLLLSVMSMWGASHRYLDAVLAVPIPNNKKITESGDITPETLPETKHYCHMFRAQEVREWLTLAELQIVAMSASSCLSIGWEEKLREIREDKEKWAELLRTELEACADPGSLNMGPHIIAVAKKD
ncbi:class I SAM-dependent methyltransferase [Candidatus Acetothermia bacterium]|nr:class I SAM-dependent methyltransferase [Candidatus Acetothermia bacterium]